MCTYDDEHPYITVAVKERWDITKVVLCAVFLYAITSLFTVILYYPISLISLIFPTVVLVYTKIALKGDQRRNLWFCIFAGFAGFALKISAIIVFVIMFPIGKEEPSRFRGSSSLRKLISVTG
ncbi:unnamed protein product [Anisakis simplex]|uniref:Aa_trans domain-containing protein n=1 Tax=Anisakis simplex TaxID=6269 RepID=A0A0M3KHN2_ANISI|nr:unnamed protein product [Anisakis simplex]